MCIAIKVKFDELAFITAIRGAGKDRDKFVRQFIAHHQGFIQKLYLETHVKKNILKDLYTDAVLLVLQHIENETFRGASKLSTYFYQIFYFQTIDHIRRQAANKIEYSDNLPEHSDEKQNFARQLEATDAMDQVVKQLESMCPVCRQIIMDWGYWGFKPEEIRARIAELDSLKYAKIKYNCLIQFKKRWERDMRSSQDKTSFF